MAEPTSAATPFQKLAAAFEAVPRVESREGTTVQVFKIERDSAAIEVSLSHGTPPVLALRAHEEEPSPSSGYRQNLLARVRKRLHYPPLLFRRVTQLDRVNAMLGLRFDARTGDAAFDRAVTVEADLADDVIAQAVGSAEARAAVLEILSAGMVVRFEERALCAELPQPAEAHLGAAVIAPVVAALVRLVASVPLSDPAVFTRRPQPGRFITAAIVVIGLLGAGALAPGTLDDVGVPVRALPHPIVPLPFMVPGLAAGSAVFVVAYLLLRWQLKRRNASTDLPLVLALYVVLAVLGVGLLDGANRLLDEEPLAVHEVKVAGKDKGTSRKSGAVNEWSLVVPSWRPGTAQLELVVDDDLHRTVRVGDTLRVTTHPGFFGWEWGAVVEKIASSSGPAAPPPEPRPRPRGERPSDTDPPPEEP